MYTFAHSWIDFVWRQKSNENGLTSQMKSALFLFVCYIFIGQQYNEIWTTEDLQGVPGVILFYQLRLPRRISTISVQFGALWIPDECR